MNAISIPPIVMSTLMFYVGFYHFLIYLRQKDNRENLTFAFSCFSVGLYSVCCAGLYTASLPEIGVQWQRFQVITLAVLGIALLLFIADYTGQTNRKIVIGFTVYYLFAALMGFFIRNDLAWTNVASIKEIRLPFGYDIRYNEMAPGVLTNFQSLVGLIYFIYIFTVALRFYRSGNKEKGMPMLMAMAILFSGLLNDTFVSSGFYDFIYILEYSYIGLIFVFTFFLTNNVIKAGEIKVALRKSEENLRTTLDSIGDAVISSDTQGCINLMNPVAEKLTGWSFEEANGKPIEEVLRIVHAKTGKKLNNPVGKVLKNGKTVSLADHSMLISKNNNKYQIADSAAPIRSDTNNIIGVVMVFRDVTEEYRMRDTVKKSEQYLHSIFRAAPIGIGLSTDRILKQITEQICKMTGYAEDKLINRSARILYPSRDDYEYVGRETNKQIQEHGTGIMETRWKCKDGRIINVLLSSTPMDTNDLSKGITFAALDITERKKANAALWKSEKRYRTLFDKTNDAIFVVEKSTGRYLDANNAASELTGRTLDELKQLTTHDVTPKNSHEYLSKINKSTGTIDLGTVIYQRPDNNNRIAKLSIVPVNDRASICIAKDITHDLEVEKQLRQSQKMEAIGTLAGGIAHDFNNILSGIFGYAQLAEMHVNDSEKIKKNLSQIVKGAKRAAELVQQILTFSRQVEYNKNPLKLSRVVKEAVKFLRSSIPVTIVIKEKISSKEIVLADSTMTHQVVMNLCTNAYHSMRDSGGILTVELNDIKITPQDHSTANYLPGNYVRLEVRDTGHGMDKETLEKIFDPYFTTKKTDKGTGLGLAMVGGIVTKHKGFMKVYSEVGLGSTFQVFWPVIEKNYSLNLQEGKNTPLLKGTEQIMLVDDETDILDTTQEILEKHGYKITTFEDGEASLKAFKEDPEKFDLVITDMAMPNISGDKLSAELIRIRPEIPIIICTGFNEKMSKEMAESLGIKGFLLKPIVMKNLSEKIREVLDKN